MQKALLLDGGHHVTNSALMGSQGPGKPGTLRAQGTEWGSLGEASP